MFLFDKMSHEFAERILGRENAELICFREAQKSGLGFNPDSLSENAISYLSSIPAYRCYDFSQKWESLPYLSKTDLRNGPDLFRPVDSQSKLRWAKFTSGTTGKPIKVSFSPRFYLQNYFNKMAKAALNYGLDFVSRNDSFALGITDNDEVEREFRVSPCGTLGRQFAYSFDPGKEGLHGVIDVIQQIRPRVISSKPSILSAICEHLKNDSHLAKVLWKPELVVSSGSELSETLRRELSQSLGSPVVSSINSTEMGFVGSECELGRFHLDHSAYFFENFGETDEIVMTNLKNAFFPLVRYRTGDRGRILNGPCACGRKGPVLERFEGRVQTPFSLGNGVNVAPSAFMHCFKDCTGLHEFQLTQTSQKSFRLEVDCDDDTQAQAIGRYFSSRFPVEVDLCVQRRTLNSNGKFERFRTEIQNDAQV